MECYANRLIQKISIYNNNNQQSFFVHFIAAPTFIHFVLYLIHILDMFGIMKINENKLTNHTHTHTHHFAVLFMTYSIFNFTLDSHAQLELFFFSTYSDNDNNGDDNDDCVCLYDHLFSCILFKDHGNHCFRLA